MFKSHRWHADRSMQYVYTDCDCGIPIMPSRRIVSRRWLRLFDLGAAWARQARIRQGVGYHQKILYYWLFVLLVAIGVIVALFCR